MLQQQEQFLHDVSHELRTPATIARGHSRSSRRTGTGRSTRSTWHSTSSAESSGSSSSSSSLQKRTIPTSSFLARSISRLISKTSSCAGRRLLRARGDSARCRRGDCALIRRRSGSHSTPCSRTPCNYTDESDAIELRARVEGKAIVLEVEDEGCGVDADSLRHIFERFARADPARSRTHGGVGLGLAIVDAIAKAHGGSCAVRSAKNGTTFSLRLPGFSPSASRLESQAPSRQRVRRASAAADQGSGSRVPHTGCRVHPRSTRRSTPCRMRPA